MIRKIDRMSVASSEASTSPFHPRGVPREEVPTCGGCDARERKPFYRKGDIVECEGCGLLYVSPRPTLEAIEAFYSAAGHYDHWDREPGRKPMWRRRVSRIRRLVPHGRLLDVGGGQGDFIAHAREHFEVEATEISREGVRLARERHGLSMHLGDVLRLDLPKESYDVVTMWHVLEHVPSPKEIVARCRELLRPNGLLVVAVPNTDSWFRMTLARIRAAAQRALGARPNRGIRIDRLELVDSTEEIHLTHFTLHTLGSLLRDAGFRICEQGLDDHSADHRLRARVLHHAHHALLRATGRATAPAIYAAVRR